MRSIVMLLVLMLATVAHAGSYTVTTTAEQDQALAQVAKQMPAGSTSQQAVQFIVERNLMTKVQAIQADQSRTAACAKVTDAQAKQALGCK